MQTFLPEPHYAASVKHLDRARLGKQRVEGLQILNTLTHHSDGWRYHPAVKMWIGYERELCVYTLEACVEWLRRGYKDQTYGRVRSLKEGLPGSARPWWFGDPDFHRSHRSNLLRKAPEHYAELPGFKGTPDDLPYLWPCSVCRTFYPRNSCKAHRGDARGDISPFLEFDRR